LLLRKHRDTSSRGAPLLLRQILASTCRQKILEALAARGDMHVMELVRRTNSTYCQVRRNLEILTENNVVIIKQHGRAKLVQLNRDNKKTQALLKALSILKSTP
jgi:DeoR/GlpR family transcriptional regulator of sugar metabolism